MSIPDTLVQQLLGAAHAPAEDQQATEQAMRRILEQRGVFVPLEGHVAYGVPAEAKVTVTSPGERAIIVPEFAEPEIQAMAGCWQLLTELHKASTWRATRRVIHWLSERMSADEHADDALDGPSNPHDEGCC